MNKARKIREIPYNSFITAQEAPLLTLEPRYEYVPPNADQERVWHLKLNDVDLSLGSGEQAALTLETMISHIEKVEKGEPFPWDAQRK